MWPLVWPTNEASETKKREIKQLDVFIFFEILLDFSVLIFAGAVGRCPARPGATGAVRTRRRCRAYAGVGPRLQQKTQILQLIDQWSQQRSKERCRLNLNLPGLTQLQLTRADLSQAAKLG